MNYTHVREYLEEKASKGGRRGNRTQPGGDDKTLRRLKNLIYENCFFILYIKEGFNMSYFYNNPFECSFSISSSTYYVSKPSFSTAGHRLVETYSLYNSSGVKIGEISQIHNSFWGNEVYYHPSPSISSMIHQHSIFLGRIKGRTSLFEPNPICKIIEDYFKKLK